MDSVRPPCYNRDEEKSVLIQVDEYELFLNHKKLKKCYPPGKFRARRREHWVRLHLEDPAYPIKRTKIDYWKVLKALKLAESEAVRLLVRLFEKSKREVGVLCKDALIMDIWSFEKMLQKLIRFQSIE